MSEDREPYAPTEAPAAKMTAEEFVIAWRELLAAGHSCEILISAENPDLMLCAISTHGDDVVRVFHAEHADPVQAFAAAFAQYQAATAGAEAGQEEAR